MNKDFVHFELSEASEHLSNLVACIAENELAAEDNSSLAIQLAHIMDHLCRAWNCRGQTPEEHGNLSQDGFNRLSHTVPNFLGERVLGEFALC